MTANETITKVCAELGLTDCDLVWFRTAKGRAYDYRLTVAGKLFRGSCVRTVIRAVRRHFCQQPKSPPLKT